ncbi:MAG: ketopantoate reductase family protein [Alicyclobacillus sp.]|nr:ketopantoate reductase family protein [Alicyclobacillus sp.]
MRSARERTCVQRIETVAWIGLGAIGAAYASRMYDWDPERVWVIVDEERRRRYEREPLTVNGRILNARYVTPQTPQPVDCILVSVKYDGLPAAIDAIRPFVGPQTVIVPLLNGISSEEMLAAVYGWERVLYAISVAIDAIREGRAVRFTQIGRICFGAARNDPPNETVERVRDLFERSGVPYEIPQDMLHTLWWKFMINVGVNQVSAVLRAPYGVFQKVTEARQLMLQAMQEVVSLAGQLGIALNQQDIDAFLQILDNMNPVGKTSMLQDIEAGRKTEVEFLAGKVCELGRQTGVCTPVNQFLLQCIRALEKSAGLHRELASF